MEGREKREAEKHREGGRRGGAERKETGKRGKKRGRVKTDLNNTYMYTTDNIALLATSNEPCFSINEASEKFFLYSERRSETSRMHVHFHTSRSTYRP